MTRKEEHLRSYGPWAIRRCDVYVCSFSPGLIDLRLDIVKDLWQAGLKADLVRPPLSSSCPSPTSALPDSPSPAADVRRRLPHAHARAARQRVPPRGHPVARHCQAERGRSFGGRRVGHVAQGQERSARCRGGRCVPFSPTAFREEVRARRARRAVADSFLAHAVPRSELSTWLIKEMREQTIVDEAVGGGSNDAVTDSSAALVDPPKPTREYIPLLADDDVRQKGRHNKRTMIAHRGASSRCSTASSDRARLTWCALFRPQPRRTSRRRPKQLPRRPSVRPLPSSRASLVLALTQSLALAVAIDIDGLAFERMANSPIWVTKCVLLVPLRRADRAGLNVELPPAATMRSRPSCTRRRPASATTTARSAKRSRSIVGRRTSAGSGSSACARTARSS